MEELLALLQSQPEFVAELLNGKTYVGELIGEPYLLKLTHQPCYSLHIRSLTRNPRLGINSGAAEIILTTGEILSVTIIMNAHVNPSPEGWASGLWTVWDQMHGIKETDLTPEQVPLARWFAQQLREQPSSSTTALPPEAARWQEEVKIKFQVLQKAEELNMTATEFDHISAQRNGYVKELQKLYGDSMPDDLKLYLQDPPKPANLRP